MILSPARRSGLPNKRTKSKEETVFCVNEYLLSIVIQIFNVMSPLSVIRELQKYCGSTHMLVDTVPQLDKVLVSMKEPFHRCCRTALSNYGLKEAAVHVFFFFHSTDKTHRFVLPHAT